MYLSAISVLFALAHLTHGAVHQVKVGPGGSLVFEPATIRAAVGDQVQFNFESGGHAVAQGDFDNACQPSDDDDAWYSGFIDSGPWTITIDDDEPYAFYCPTTGHCEAGMVGVINPADDETLEAYSSAATSADGSSVPANVQGGVPKAASAAGSASSTDSAPSESSSAASDNGAAALVMNSVAAGIPLGVVAYVLL